MRARNSLWLLIVVLLGITQLSPSARPQAGAGLTGAVLIEQLRSAGESLIASGQGAGHDLILDAAQRLGLLATQLQAILKDQVTQPIDSLDGNLRAQAYRALATLNTTKAFISNLEECTATDAGGLIATFTAAVRQTTGDVVPWSPSQPQVFRIIPRGRSEVLGFRTTPWPETVDIVGTNLGDSDCDIAVEIGKGNAWQAAEAPIAHNPELVTVQLPRVATPGDYGVRVTPKARRWYTAWLACTSSRSTSYAITILPPAAFTIDWQVRASCQAVDRHEVKAGGFGGTNSSCSAKSFPVQWSPPAKEGYRIVSARQVDRVTRDHCNASGPNGRGWDITPDGGAIAGSIVCEGRSGRNPFGCSGGGTGYEFDLFATIERMVPTEPVSRAGTLSNLGFGGTAQAPVGALCPSPTGVTLLGTVHYPSGVPDQLFVPASEKMDVPIALSLPDGARLDWEPKSATVTAAAPLNRCKSIY